MTWRYAGLECARRCGNASAQLFADFRPDQVKEEDQVEQALNECGSLMLAGKYPQVVGHQKKDGSQRQRPGPAEEHEQAGACCDECGSEDEKQRRIVAPGDDADNDDSSKDKEIEADGGQTREREKIAARGLRPALFDFVGFGVERHKVWR